MSSGVPDVDDLPPEAREQVRDRVAATLEAVDAALADLDADEAQEAGR